MSYDYYVCLLLSGEIAHNIHGGVEKIRCPQRGMYSGTIMGVVCGWRDSFYDGRIQCKGSDFWWTKSLNSMGAVRMLSMDSHVLSCSGYPNHLMRNS